MEIHFRNLARGGRPRDHADDLPEAYAQTAAAAADKPTDEVSSVGEITVTARKKVENLQRVPAAVTSVSGGVQLEQQGIRQTDDLERRIASLTVFTAAGNAPPRPSSACAARTAGDDLLTLSTPVGILRGQRQYSARDGLNGPVPGCRGSRS